MQYLSKHIHRFSESSRLPKLRCT